MHLRSEIKLVLNMVFSTLLCKSETGSGFVASKVHIKNRRMKIIKTVLALMVLCTTLSGSWSNETKKFDKVLTDELIRKFQDSLGIPGIALGIAIGDEIIYTATSGYANLETGTELTLNSIWHICSVSKQFSAVACLRLAEEHRLSLTDRISEYIDGLPAGYSDITILNLLSHTSGIKDYLNDKGLYGLPWENVSKEIFSDTLNFKPGDKWSYSNTGFWLIARIIEKVTGTDYNSYIGQNFFDFLEMSHSQRVSAKKIIRQRVNGYTSESGFVENQVKSGSEFYGQGDGDIMSTLPDLLKWNMALTHNKLINEQSLSLLWTPSKLNNGEISETIPGSGVTYGLGWFIREVNGEKIVWTPGAGFGFSISSMYIPSHRMTIIVLCNKDQFLMADEIGFSVAGTILKQYDK